MEIETNVVFPVIAQISIADFMIEHILYEIAFFLERIHNFRDRLGAHNYLSEKVYFK